MPPHTFLSPYIDAYWKVTGSQYQLINQKILPDGCVDIILNVGEDIPDADGQFCLKNESAYLGRAAVKEALLDYKGANEDYTKALDLNANNGAALFSRGVAKTKLNDFKGAVEDYDKAIAIDATNANAYYNRGVAKQKIGQKESGCQDFDKATELGNTSAANTKKVFCK